MKKYLLGLLTVPAIVGAVLIMRRCFNDRAIIKSVEKLSIADVDRVLRYSTLTIPERMQLKSKLVEARVMEESYRPGDAFYAGTNL